MLEIAAIKTTPQSSETQSRSGKIPSSPLASDESAQEFQTEYEATAEDAERASDEDAKDASTTKEQNSKAEVEIEAQVEPENVATVEEEDVLVELVMGEGRESKEQFARKIAPEMVKSELPNSQPATPQKGRPRLQNLISQADRVSSTPPEDSSKTDQFNAEGKQKEATVKSAAETVFMSKTAALSNEPKIIDAQVKAVDKTQPVSTNAQAQIPQPPDVLNKASEAWALEMPRSKKLEEIQLRRTEKPIEAPKTPQANTAAVPFAQATVPQAQTSMKIEASKDKTDLLSVVSTDAETLGVFETRSGSLQQTTQALAQVLNRADTPTLIARQIAEAMQRLPDRPVEISLNPKELGKVRMSVSPFEAGITVNIVAERPETLDLMRRNIEQLVREFQSIGYDNINFAFSQGDSNNGFSDNETDGSETLSTHLDLTNEEEPQVTRSEALVSTGVDIRL
ncbi:MAG: flagellar hook-length control protein FliK [Roseobacter sp.]